MITFEEFPKEGVIEGALAQNSSWNIGCPFISGKNYNECLQAFNLKKIIQIRKIKKDLRKLEDQTDNEFSIYVLSIVAREIAVCNWQAKSGPWAVWLVIFDRSLGRARKVLNGKSDMESIAKGVFKHGKQSEARDAIPVPEQRLRGTSRAAGFGG